jgi:hypothetical protein
VVQVGDSGPAGGKFRSLGRPAVSPAGRTAFRATFEPTADEPNRISVGGFYLQSDSGLTPFVSNGDAAPLTKADGMPLGGRFSAFNQRAALSSNDTLGFIASLSGSSGKIENGIFVASPSTFQVKRARIKLGTTTKADKLQLAAALDPGSLAEGFDPTTVRLSLTVRDAGSAVWTQDLNPGELVKKGKQYVFKAPPDVGIIALQISKTHSMKLKVRAQPDFSGGGVFPFEPPALVRLELGDVSGQASVDCAPKGRSLSCK